ncbi:hypothetical protein SAMN04487998_3124 [Hymenobacter actinosclerus]|uniref:Uncharacterized protein n=1 Tax=Hymenobacter actinosclerus TaxID=82805 RepID=A0A1I0I5X4_9BACT|nr:hypothetical protein SAMN04487998_3124 [Hymenobacter actinosclerus]
MPTAPVPLVTSPPVAAVAGATVPPAAVAALARPAPQLKRTGRQLRTLTPLRARRPATAARTDRADTLHWVLGGALVVAGIVGGLLLGGWLGLGVGAALVLLGYYFVVLGIGGRQAWLEVFQEFFNM